jgi:hypothetical protein
MYLLLLGETMDTDRMERRRLAAERGELRYDPGTPCKRGHTSPRYVSTGGCCACINTSYKPMRSAFSTQLVPYHNAHLWTVNGLPKNERIALRAYLQRCIFLFIKEHAKAENGKPFLETIDKEELLAGIQEIEDRLTRLSVDDPRNTD